MAALVASPGTAQDAVLLPRGCAEGMRRGFAGAGELRLWRRVRSGVPHPAGPRKVPARRGARLSPRHR